MPQADRTSLSNKSPSVDAAPKTQVQSRSSRPASNNAGCIFARIVGKQIEGGRARLLIAVPREAGAHKDMQGHVEGLPDSGFAIEEIVEGNFAVARTFGRLDIAELEGHSSAVIDCLPRRTPATAPVHARIIKREEVGGQRKITIGAGYAQGVFRGMRGKLSVPNSKEFVIQDVETDRSCYALVDATHDELQQYPSVVILP